MVKNGIQNWHTFDHAIKPRIGFHYHKLGMHTKGLNWKFSRLRRCPGHHRWWGTRRPWTSPNTETRKYLEDCVPNNELQSDLNVVVVDFVPESVAICCKCDDVPIGKVGYDKAFARQDQVAGTGQVGRDIQTSQQVTERRVNQNGTI